MKWLNEEAEHETSRFKRFLECRPQHERALRWLLREPVKAKDLQPEKRHHIVARFQRAIETAKKCVGPDAMLVTHGLRRLKKIQETPVEELAQDDDVDFMEQEQCNLDADQTCEFEGPGQIATCAQLTLEPVDEDFIGELNASEPPSPINRAGEAFELDPRS